MPSLGQGESASGVRGTDTEWVVPLPCATCQIACFKSTVPFVTTVM